MIVQQLLLQLVLIGINAFFAATEIAMISLNNTKLKKDVIKGDKIAEKLVAMVESPSGFLSTIQVGITMSGFLASAFAADSFSDPIVSWITTDLGFNGLSVSALDTLAVIGITLVLSYFMLIFGELVPKRIAMQKSMVVARFSCKIISVISVIMKPVILFLSLSTNIILKLLGMKVEAEEDTITEEEIRLMVDLGRDRGTIDPEEREMIENIFEFDNTSIRNVMTHYLDVKAVSLSMTTEDIIELIHDTGMSRFPVYEGDLDHIIGILNAKEFLLNCYSKTSKKLEEMIRPAYFVPETILADVLFRDMQREKVHFAVVVGEYGETVGIITMEDLLEEIVGNIYDEFDPQDEADIQLVSDNLWRVSGDAPLDELEEALDIKFPDDIEVDTLGGLVLSTVSTIPADGTAFKVEAYGLLIEVDKISKRRIVETHIRKVADVVE